MFLSNQNNNQNKQPTAPKFYPGNASLNKNADGLICSINTTQANVQQSRMESRIEYYRNQKPQAAPMNTNAGLGGFGQQPQTQSSMFGQQQPQQTSMFGQQQSQQPSLFGTQPAQGGLTGGLGSGLGGGLGLGLQQQSGLGQTNQNTTFGGLGSGLGAGLGGGLTGGLGQTGFGTGLGGGLIGGLGQPAQQQTGLGAFGQPQQQQTSLLGFGQQQQQQQQPSLFGGAPTGLGLGGLGQQQQQQQQQTFGLFGQQQQQPGLLGQQMQQPMMINQCAYPNMQNQQPNFGQQPMGENYNPAYPYPQQQIDIDFDFKNEQEYLNEIEDEFKRKIPTFSEYANEMTFSVGNVNLRIKNPSVEIKIKQKQKPKEDIKPYYACINSDNKQRQAKSAINKSMYESLKNQSKDNSQISEPIVKQQQSEVQQNNPNAPICQEYQLQPSLQQLYGQNDIQLTRVRDFKISNQFGIIHFLEAVDLKGLNIDSIVKLQQDSVEFYPDGSIPEYGKGLNVRCKVVLKNFACENRTMCELRINNKKEFEKKIRNWAEKNKMKFISAGDDVVFELDQL